MVKNNPILISCRIKIKVGGKKTEVWEQAKGKATHIGSDMGHRFWARTIPSISLTRPYSI